MKLLLSRRSVAPKHLVAPAPSDADLQQMVQAALRAPDHGALLPFRFAVVRSDDARRRLAQLFTQAALDAGKDAAAAAQDADRALRPPLTVALVARIADDHAVPVHEQWIAVGAALGQFLTAAHALGYAGKMLSGAKARHPALQAAFCDVPGETLVGWIALGTAAGPPAREPPAKPGTDAVCRDW